VLLRYQVVMLCAVACALSGCRVSLVDIPPQTLEVRYFELPLPDAGPGRPPAWYNDRVLIIEPFLTADAYDTRFYTSLGTGEVQPEDTNRWIQEPGRLLSDAFHQGLVGTELFGHVLDARSGGRGDLVLEGKVMQFSKALSPTSPHGQAVLRVALSVRAKESSSIGGALWKKAIAVNHDLNAQTPDAFVAAMSANVEAVLAAFLNDLSQVQ
jgi:ABC-type uncharacterized transport system auxiliary subunit